MVQGLDRGGVTFDRVRLLAIRSIANAGLIVACAAVAGCGEDVALAPWTDGDAQHEAPSSGVSESTPIEQSTSEESGGALVLQKERERFVSPSALGGSPASIFRSLRSQRGSPGGSALAGTSFARSVIGEAQGLGFDATLQGLRPRLASASSAEVMLGHRADEGFELRDIPSGARVSVRLAGARTSHAVTVGGMLLYPGAGPDGGNVIHRVTEQGTEDYVVLQAPLAQPGLSYTVELAQGVAGLRLVSNVLEMLDAAGAPRLRMTAPAIVDTNGVTVRGRLQVEGCTVDTDPSPPWGRSPEPPGATECLVRVQWDEDRLTYPLLVDPSWTSTGNLVIARSGASSVVVPGNRVLVMGGMGSDYTTPLASSELFDPSSQTWAAVADMSTGRLAHSAVRIVNGQVLVTGGYDAEGAALATTELFDSTSGRWANGPRLRVARSWHQSVLLGSGDVLVAGGSDTTSEKLPARGTSWRAAASLPSSQFEHTLTALKDGRALLVGGGIPLLYSAASNVWTPVVSGPTDGRYGHAATLLNDGRVLVTSAALPSAELFDPSNNQWRSAGSLISPRSTHTATLLTDGRVLIAGGYTPGLSPDASVEIYNPVWVTFAPGPELSLPRVDHFAASLPNGGVLVAGGLDVQSYNVLSSTEQFSANTYSSTITEYKLPAVTDVTVLDDRPTELWASLSRPNDMPAGKKYPLLVFLHGNHGTCGTGTNPRTDWSCEYTDTGTCPAGYVVTPNHRGYDYVTSELASLGFMVVSINANRGINCGGGVGGDFGLNLARGRLILRHLQQLSEWNRGVAPTPASLGVNLSGLLDLSQVGIMGHSRGGEGARAAYEQYRDLASPWPARIVDPLSIRAIFEIGPVDGQSDRVLNADGIKWNVLLPACDGDVSDLQGVRPFDRMLGLSSSSAGQPKSTYVVWGANHNYFNTEWQVSDSPGCANHEPLFGVNDGSWGSAAQRQIGLRSLYDFFTANVGKAPTPKLADLFNPEIFPNFSSRVDRGYSPGETVTESLKLEEFTNAAGTSSFNVKNVHKRVQVTHGTLPSHDEALKGATVSWTSAGSGTYFQINFANPGAGLDLRNYALLDVRVDRSQDPLNTRPITDVNVQLVNHNDTLTTAVPLGNYVALSGPALGAYGEPHAMLPTARIPLNQFGAAHLSRVRGVRFTFPSTPTGAIYLASIRATRSTVGATTGTKAPSTALAQVVGGAAAVSSARVPSAPARVVAGNGIQAVRTTPDGASVEVTLDTATSFPVRNELPVLDIGGVQQSLQSRHPQGNLKQLVFRMPRATFDALPAGAPLRVRYGKGAVWDFGAFDTARLDK
jgi:Kelch motif